MGIVSTRRSMVGIIVTAALTVSACSATENENPSNIPTLKVGVFLMAQTNIANDIAKAFEGQLKKDLPNRRVELDLKNSQGDPTLITSIAREFANSKDDIFVALGSPAVIALAQQVKTKPIFGVGMGDPVGAKVAKSLELPGGNVTGTIDYIDPGLLLDQIDKVKPNPARIGTIYDPGNQNMQIWVDALKKAAAARSKTLVDVTTSNPSEMDAAARSLVGRVDAILIGPDATNANALPPLGAVGLRAKLPVYLAAGDITIPGIFATLGPDYVELGRQTASIAAKVVNGASPGSVAFGRPGQLSWAVNDKTSSTLGISAPASAQSN